MWQKSMRRLKRCRGVFTGVCGVRFSHFSQSAFNELTYHFSAQLRKLYYFKSIMNPVAIYHFFKKYFCFFICFVVYDQMAISREGGRRKVAKKLWQVGFSVARNALNSPTVNYQNFSAAKMRVLI